MKFFKKMKDGGAESTVTGYTLIEIKSLFSIVLVRFDGASREAFHNHAFNCLNWLLSGRLLETELCAPGVLPKFRNFRGQKYSPSFKPFIITRDRFHQVDSETPTSWVLSFRGPWAKTWKEFLPLENRERTLAHGRIEV